MCVLQHIRVYFHRSHIMTAQFFYILTKLGFRLPTWMYRRLIACASFFASFRSACASFRIAARLAGPCSCMGGGVMIGVRSGLAHTLRGVTASPHHLR